MSRRRGWLGTRSRCGLGEITRYPGRRSGRPGRPDQAGAVGGDDELGTVTCAELHEQPADVSFRRGQADVHVGCDLGVGQAESDQGQDFAFPAGYLFQRRRLVLLGLGAAGELADEPPGDAGGEQLMFSIDDSARAASSGWRVTT